MQYIFSFNLKTFNFKVESCISPHLSVFSVNGYWIPLALLIKQQEEVVSGALWMMHEGLFYKEKMAKRKVGSG